MITLWVGTIGSGKTCLAVKRIINLLDEGRTVLTNISINRAASEKFNGRAIDWELYRYINVEQLLTLPEWCPRGTEQRPVVCVIDEASEWFDAYEQPKKLEKLLSFFRQSRKMGVDFQFITQDECLIQKRIRILASMLWRHSDGQKMRIPNLGLPLPPPWRYAFATVGWDRTGRTMLTGVHWDFRDSRLFACYKTEELYRSMGGEKIVEKKRDDEMKKSEKLMLVFAAVASAAAVVVCGYLLFFAEPPERVIVERVINNNAVASRSLKRDDVSSVDSVTRESIYLDVPVAIIDGKRAWIDGGLYDVGQLTPYGMLMSVSHVGPLVLRGKKLKILKNVKEKNLNEVEI